MILAQAHPHEAEDELAERLLQTRPQAWPNSRMITFADERSIATARSPRRDRRHYTTRGPELAETSAKIRREVEASSGKQPPMRTHEAKPPLALNEDWPMPDFYQNEITQPASAATHPCFRCGLTAGGQGVCGDAGQPSLYVAGGCGDERTQEGNVAVFDNGAAASDTRRRQAARRSIELFGMRLPSPLFEPDRRHRLCGQDGHGDLATARAAALTGVPGASTLWSIRSRRSPPAKRRRGSSALHSTDRELAVSLVGAPSGGRRRSRLDTCGRLAPARLATPLPQLRPLPSQFFSDRACEINGWGAGEGSARRGCDMGCDLW